LSLVFNFILLLVSFFSTNFDVANVLPLFGLQLSIKCIADFVYLSTGASFFRRKELLWWFLPAQFAHIIYISLVGVLGNFLSYQWKGRKYKK